MGQEFAGGAGELGVEVGGVSWAWRTWAHTVSRPVRASGRFRTGASWVRITFPALLARALSDLTADERHVLRSVSLLDAFDLDLATHAAGLTHQAPARRLTERPIVTENPYAPWPYHLHGAVRSALTEADDHTDDRWTPADWHQAANLARLAGDFPTALAAVPALGWKGRHHRVLGDIHWSHADTAQAVNAFEAGRTEAEQHGAVGERAITQVRLALALSFADPARAELALAHQLLNGLDQRSNTLLAQVVALIKDAGTHGITGRAQDLHTDIEAAGLPFLHRFVELALAFHHAVRGEDQALTATIDRLRALTATGDFAYFTDIAHFMAGLPLPSPSLTHWLDGQTRTRQRWRALDTARREQQASR
ncbi:hypothetical protein [Streptomyces sp. NPDC088270]|uniref:hypothetical protein n=1 Tax=Streptomyces sp. NPDC088270 TaxID=3160990 RepID=UPI00342A002C